MINFLLGFLGSFLGSLLGSKLYNLDNSDNSQDETLQREPPKGIGMYSDPLERYERYLDYDSKLYAPVNKGGIRVER